MNHEMPDLTTHEEDDPMATWVQSKQEAAAKGSLTFADIEAALRRFGPQPRSQVVTFLGPSLYCDWQRQLSFLPDWDPRTTPTMEIECPGYGKLVLVSKYAKTEPTTIPQALWDAAAGALRARWRDLWDEAFYDWLEQPKEGL